MKIVYTKHAQKKFKDLEKLGVKISKKDVNSIIGKPVHVDKKSDYPKQISSGNLDAQHVLRVVHREENGTIIVITFYPAKKGRYF